MARARSARTRSSSWLNATCFSFAIVGAPVDAHESRESLIKPRPQGSAPVDRLRRPSRCEQKPPDAAAASCHGDTAPTTPSRRWAAAAHAPITSTASANGLGRAGSGPVTGSSCTSNAVNIARTASALPANARNQPRTVEAGLHSVAAIGRCPAPSAFNRSAAPITSTPSARRSRHDTATSTCVTAQMPHRVRRGRSWPTPRTDRSRACPHGARTPPHGQASSPARRRPSTSTTSLPTMTTGASTSTKERPSHPAKEQGGPLRFQNVIRLSSHTNQPTTAGTTCDRPQPQCRYTRTSSSYGVPFNSQRDQRLATSNGKVPIDPSVFARAHLSACCWVGPAQQPSCPEADLDRQCRGIVGSRRDWSNTPWPPHARRSFTSWPLWSQTSRSQLAPCG